MTRFRQALREAGALLVIAAALGMLYAAAKERGVFAKTQPSLSLTGSGPNTPSMTTREEAWSLFRTGSALFIDSRHDFDYREGHITGAQNLPLKDFDAKKSLLNDVPKDRTIVVYCDGAECNSSIELAVKLMNGGFKNVRIFFGGWREWLEAKYPTEKTP